MCMSAVFRFSLTGRDAPSLTIESTQKPTVKPETLISRELSSSVRRRLLDQKGL